MTTWRQLAVAFTAHLPSEPKRPSAIAKGERCHGGFVQQDQSSEFVESLISPSERFAIRAAARSPSSSSVRSRQRSRSTVVARTAGRVSNFTTSAARPGLPPREMGRANRLKFITGWLHDFNLAGGPLKSHDEVKIQNRRSRRGSRWGFFTVSMSMNAVRRAFLRGDARWYGPEVGGGGAACLSTPPRDYSGARLIEHAAVGEAASRLVQPEIVSSRADRRELRRVLRRDLSSIGR